MTSNAQLMNQSSHSGDGWAVVGEENMTLPVCDLQEQLEKVRDACSTLPSRKDNNYSYFSLQVVQDWRSYSSQVRAEQFAALARWPGVQACV